MDTEHRDCWCGEPCAVGKPHECPPCLAAAKRDRGRPWSVLVTEREPGGLRHYLDGQPVHCGAAIVLQARTTKADDYGEYTHWLQEGVRVRYEAAITHDDIRATLHAGLGGHEFTAAVEGWMRFRWPQQGA